MDFYLRLHWRSDYSPIVALPVGYGHSDWRNSELGNRKGIEGKSPKRMNRASAARSGSIHGFVESSATKHGNGLRVGSVFDPKYESLHYQFLSKRMAVAKARCAY
jgi:hypothetical protein